MARQSYKKEMRVIRGVCLPKDQKQPSDEADDDEEVQDEEEEQQEPEFLDVAEIDSVSSGGLAFNSSSRLETVKVQDIGGKVHLVEGRFPLQDPWWVVRCMVAAGRRRTFMQGFPFYRLCSDLNRENWVSIVSLFLKACGVQEDIVFGFFEWLPQDTIVTFDNLAEIIGEFAEGNKDQAEMITTSITRSDAGKQVYAGLKYPRVVKFLPNLLPRQFSELLKQCNARWLGPTEATLAEQKEDGEDDDLLARLEHIIAADVWKLGFTEILKRELKLVRCEASLKSFQDCSLLRRMPQKQQSALRLYDYIKRTCYRRGCTYVELTELLCHVKQARPAIQFLSDQKVVVVVDEKKVVLQSFYQYESGIARCLSHLVKSRGWRLPVNATEVLQAAAEERQRRSEKLSTTDALMSPFKLDPDQVRAAEMICANPVTIISGKAGCGKTTAGSQLFKAAVLKPSEQEEIREACEVYENDSRAPLCWEEAPLSAERLSQAEERHPIQTIEEILLTAPTGRAASLLSKNTGFPAYTLHQVLFNFIRKSHKKVDDKQWKFSDVSVLVVDEGSMVPVWLLHTVLVLLIQHAQLRKLVILGDVRQLPSIQPGNVLTDLFNSLRCLRWAIEMKTNHRAESKLIVHNATIIAESGQRRKFSPLDFDAKVVVDRSAQHLPDDKKFILIRLPEDSADDVLQQAVKFLIEKAPGLKDHSTSQFIAFKNSDVNLINELCCKHYNNHLTGKSEKKLLFRPGDKVCCTRNGYVEDVSDFDALRRREPQESKRLCNGEIYFIKEDKTEVSNDGRKQRYLTLDDGQGGQELTVNFRQLQRECKLKHAWARTIHTFQGSENETIVYVVGDSRAQTWKHIYTAVTRGQKRVYVVTRESVMESTIERREIPRRTRLAHLVREQVVRPCLMNLPRTPSSCHSTPAQAMPPQTCATTVPRARTAVKRLWSREEEDTPSLCRQDGSSDLQGAAEHPSPCKQPRAE